VSRRAIPQIARQSADSGEYKIRQYAYRGRDDAQAIRRLLEFALAIKAKKPNSTAK
jgi:hypothetical protein